MCASSGGSPGRTEVDGSGSATMCAPRMACGELPVNGGCAGQHLVGHDAEGVDVRPVVHRRDRPRPAPAPCRRACRARRPCEVSPVPVGARLSPTR